MAGAIGPAMDLLTARAPVFMLGGVALGLALPPLAEAMRPLVVPVSIGMAVVSMLRVEPARLYATLRRPVFVFGAGLFALFALPMAVASLAFLAGAPAWLATGLTYASAAPPLSSAAAFAILVRIDPALVTGISLPATLLAPLTVWLVTALAPGLGVGVDIFALVLRLAAIILGAFAVALLLRRLVGENRVRGWARPLDAATVALVTVIGIGVMHDIGLALRSDPLDWLGIFALTFALNICSLVLAVAAFWAMGRDEAFAAGLCASVKNMAVMVAAVLGTVDPRIALVVITAQLPIFFAPVIMRPLFARLRRGRAAP
jgi:predicted Na+-dependent transporter